MLQKPKCPIIALEEHYADDELVATYTGLDVNPVPAIVTRLRDVGEERLKALPWARLCIDDARKRGR